MGQPSEGAQIVFFSCLDVYQKSPFSGGRQYKSETLKTTICSSAGEVARGVGARLGVAERRLEEANAENCLLRLCARDFPLES